MKKIYGTFGVEMRAYGQKLVKFCKHTHASPIVVLAGLPGFARDSCSVIMSICAFHFYIIYFHFFSADHGIPQTFDYILTT